MKIESEIKQVIKISRILILAIIAFLMCVDSSFSQNIFDISKGRKNIDVSSNPAKYIKPSDSVVAQNLIKWKSYKVGVMITWGVFTQWGIIDSWTLCSYDAGWNHRTGPYAYDYGIYKKQYEKIYTYFNPVNFDPDAWAAAFKNAGVKYVLAMAKHLDGFCMYNTETTDYRITSPDCPFHTNPKSNIAFEICDAVKKNGMSAGVVFSKSDWYSNDFWWRYFGLTWLDVNYNTSVYPEKWIAFKNYTYNQLNEITGNFGKLDVLWLNGSWVSPGSSMDIDMPALVQKIRRNQPGLIVVDRACGQFEDYLTYESIPVKPLETPWELVMPMGSAWGHIPGIYYYSADSLVHTLIEVVAKGGNILWGIGPDSTGSFEPGCYARLHELGDWMNVNGNAIYGTSFTQPFYSGNVFFTAKHDTVFAMYRAQSNQKSMPSCISWKGIEPKKDSKVFLLGSNTPLKWKTDSNGQTFVEIPENLQSNPPCLYAWTIRFVRNILGAEAPEIPANYNLGQNYPNPFNPITSIDFALPFKSYFKINLYDALGRKIRTILEDTKPAGFYTLSFDASSLPSGIYFYSLITGNKTIASRKMVYVK